MSTLESLTKEFRALCSTEWKSPLRNRSDWSWFEGHPLLCEEGILRDLSEDVRVAVDIADSALHELRDAYKKGNKTAKVLEQTQETILRLSLIVNAETQRRNEDDEAAGESIRASFKAEALKKKSSKVLTSESSLSSSSPRKRLSTLKYKRREIEREKEKQRLREIKRERERVRKRLQKQLQVRDRKVKDRANKVGTEAHEFFKEIRGSNQEKVLERFRQTGRIAMRERLQRVRELRENIEQATKRISEQKELAHQKTMFEQTKERMRIRIDTLNSEKRAIKSRAKKIREEIDIMSISEATKTISRFTSPFEAVRRGKLKVLKSFFAVRGFDKMLVLRERRGGKTLLHHACRRGHQQIVRFLVDAGSDVNVIDTAYNRFTPLLEAARAGHSSICRFLVRRGAKSNHKDFGGDTMIHWAVRRGHGNVLKDVLSDECKNDGTEGLLKMRNERGKIAGDVAKNETISRLFERALDVEISRKEKRNLLKRRVKSGILRANIAGQASGMLWKVRSKDRLNKRISRTAG